MPPALQRRQPLHPKPGGGPPLHPHFRAPKEAKAGPGAVSCVPAMGAHSLECTPSVKLGCVRVARNGLQGFRGGRWEAEKQVPPGPLPQKIF